MEHASFLLALRIYSVGHFSLAGYALCGVRLKATERLACECNQVPMQFCGGFLWCWYPAATVSLDLRFAESAHTRSLGDKCNELKGWRWWSWWWYVVIGCGEFGTSHGVKELPWIPSVFQGWENWFTEGETPMLDKLPKASSQLGSRAYGCLRMPRVWSCVAKAVTFDPVTCISTGKEYICNSKAREQVQ